ncbi:MAG: hypothetical protein ACI8QS_000224 [Planctomycetota bacterium]|jgi:hypothetical protein
MRTKTPALGLLLLLTSSCVVAPGRFDSTEPHSGGQSECPECLLNDTASPPPITAEAQVPTVADPEWMNALDMADALQPLPQASQDLRLPDDADLNLSQLLQLWSEATGIAYVHDNQVHMTLKGMKSIPSATTIKAEDVQTFVQLQLKRSGFFLLRIGSSESGVVMVVEANSGRAAAGLRSFARFVHPEEISAFAGQHALLAQTVLELPGVDVRQLSTSLRSLLTDTNTQNLISAGTHSVLVQGTGDMIFQLAIALKEISRQVHATQQ